MNSVENHAILMSSNASVSVVIPAYNAAKWIDATLQSVLMQAGIELDIIVVDDGSTDETREIVAKYSSVRYFHKPNGGQASARNLGIHNSYGEFIAFIDADDVWFSEKLCSQVALLRSQNLSWCYCDGVAFTKSPGNILYAFSDVQAMHEGEVLEQLLLGNFVPSPSPVVSRSVFDQVGFFNEDSVFRNREDWDMWLRIAEYYPLGYLRKRFFGYRLHAQNSTRIEDHANALYSKMRVISETMARNPCRLKSLAQQARSNQYINSTKAAMRSAQNALARNIAKQLLSEQPTNLSAYVLWLFSHLPSGVIKQFLAVRDLFRTRVINRKR